MTTTIRQVKNMVISLKDIDVAQRQKEIATVYVHAFFLSSPLEVILLQNVVQFILESYKEFSIKHSERIRRAGNHELSSQNLYH